MPVFQYRGVDNQGQWVSGMMAAASESALEERLKSTGHWLLHAESQPDIVDSKPRIGPKSWLASWGEARRRDLIEFCTMMAFQTKAGIPLFQAIEVAMHDCENPRFKKVIQGIHHDVEGGLLFYEAIEKYPDIFTPNFVSMIRAGEVSGKLPETFEELRAYLEWVDKIIADVRQASLYPAIVLTVVCCFVLFLFSYIIPKFAALLESTHAKLPLITTIIFGLSDFAKSTWYIWLILLLTVTLGTSVMRRWSKRFALWIDRQKISLPVLGEINLMLAMSRFANNLGILYRSGIPIVQYLKHCQGLTGNAVVEDAITDVGKGVENGEAISEALKRHPVFPNILLRMVAMGERTGTLDAALQNVADYYNQVIPRRIKKLFTVLEPALMVFLIGLVGCVALAIFLPIISLMNAIK